MNELKPGIPPQTASTFMGTAFRMATISATKVIISSDRSTSMPEDLAARYELSAADVMDLAEKLRTWISESRFRSLSAGSEVHPDVPQGTQLRQTGTVTPPSPIWFIGDLHGDLGALQVLTRFAHAQNEHEGVLTPTQLFFLGDFIDGAPFSAEVVAWVMGACNADFDRTNLQEVMENKAQFVVHAVAGNHEDGLRFVDNDTGGEFLSTVSPSSFAEELNERMRQDNGAVWKKFGIKAIEFFKTLPRMVLLDKTVMVAHGGAPHTDVEVFNRGCLETQQALSDFVWNRLHETAPKKVPNRESHGSQQGIKDFEEFISKLAGIDDICCSPRAFIRGHDHHPGNFKHYENYKSCLVLTLNAFTINRDSYGEKFRDLAILRWLPSDADNMTLFRLKFETGDLQKLWSAMWREASGTDVGPETT